MKLTDAKLRTLSEPGKYFDGAGLFLDLTAAGGRYWRLKYRIAGKEKLLALGVYPAVSLKDAREMASQARQAIQSGDDPAEQRKAAKSKAVHESVNTFRAVALEWMEHQSARWEPLTRERIHVSLETNVLKALGARPLASIKPLEVMNAVKAVEARGAGEQAGRVLQRVKAIFRWAVIHGRLDSNPMLDLMPAEILKPREVQHRAALDAKELPAFLAQLDAYDGDPHTVHALRLLMLTATRPGEVRGARWDEVDMDAAMWTIPAERMKMRQEHRIPLSSQALELLQSMQALSGGRELVFPSPFYPSKPLSENTFNSAMARMGYKNLATAHGFRALFSTVANETGWRPDVIERQLAHKERNEVRAAYHRSTYMAERTKLLQWWADYLEGCKSGKVLHLRQRAG
ncbi:tyrosine-type recombinase/integrase [Comamonas resistens]|uniref:Tyrosine-type recombinase/integrase n=1 Tax=Comamonas resistens TaxID=3046670 RepID=A0ABY8SP46_9BURK|nr:tyrosine-type recombinase/integrase [Comamonas resistens]MDL5036356.1 tyrosine-type recombinase/integrase [Comamonas resistens]WHS64703.1 tyrosine-type recombinase/integrase [Comamonas resistens]